MNDMTSRTRGLISHGAITAILMSLAGIAMAQQPGGPPPDEDPGFPPIGFPPPGFGSMGPGGGPPADRKLVGKYDRDGDGRLNEVERKVARAEIAREPKRGFGGPGMMRRGGQSKTPPQAGPKVTPDQVAVPAGKALFDPQTVRTVFIEFPNADWEKELGDFSGSDVDVPARMQIDGRTFADVGVHFRGMSSLQMVGEGWKRSLNLSLDFVHEKQSLDGVRTLNLLNSHEDPSFLRSVLYSRIAGDYIPTPRAGFMQVVINGESWGLYVLSEQFNKDFVKDRFGSAKLARWKVPGRPNGQGSLAYLGDDPKAYQAIYELKSKESDKAWADLIRLCRVLNTTPPERLVAELAPMLDIDGALKFLALENVFINNDGYWVRSSDYSLAQDQQGRFHPVPHDSNETFAVPGGPGFGMGRGRPGGGAGPGAGAAAGGPPTGGPGSGSPIQGVELDPLYAAQDTAKPLISKLLAVPELRTRYLGFVRDIAEKWLAPERLDALADTLHGQIADAVRADTRKLDSTEEFEKSLTAPMPARRGFGPPGAGGHVGIKTFAALRRAYLLGHPEIRRLSADRGSAGSGAL
jgi:hypothetical protein